jgi:hypothetical protein
MTSKDLNTAVTVNDLIAANISRSGCAAAPAATNAT